MESVNTVYIDKKGWQPTCAGIDERGELVWGRQAKETWHLEMFPVRYDGDFKEHWMRLLLVQKYGLEWEGD